MKLLGWNLALALAWCAMAGRLAIDELVLGFVIGYVMLAWLSVGDAARRYARRAPSVLGFIAIYALDLISSSIRVAWDVVTPASRRHPAIIEVQLEVTTGAEIALLVNLVTFSPGSLVLDLAEDRRTLTVHAMFARDPETARDQVKRFERWVMRILR